MADAWEVIESTTLSGTSTGVTFSSLTTDYVHLMVKMTVRTDLNTTPGHDYVGIHFNGDTAGNYGTTAGTGANTTLGVEEEAANVNGMKVRATACDPENALMFGQIEVVIPSYQSTNQNGCCFGNGGKAGTSYGFDQFGGGYWDNTAAITSVTLNPGGGTNFNIGSTFTIYGLRSS
jgi:hypothetical protein